MHSIFDLQKILTFCSYVFWFLILNLLFLIINIPSIFLIILIGFDGIPTYLPLFLISLIPFGPSLSILFYCVGKIIRNKDINLIDDIKNAFKLNFKQSLIVWVIQLVLIFILYMNLNFFSEAYPIKPLYILLLLVAFFIALMTPYIYLLISRFSMTTMDIIKNSMILAITRPLLNFSNILCVVVLLIAYQVSPGTTFLFMGSSLTFLIYFGSLSLLNEIEKNNG